MSAEEGSNTGYSFLATVIAAGIIGFFIDKFFGTQPWGLMGFLLFGIVYATYKAQMAMQEPQQNLKPIEEGKKEDEKE